MAGLSDSERRIHAMDPYPWVPWGASKRPKGPLRPRRLRDPTHGAPMVPALGSHRIPHGIPWHLEIIVTNTHLMIIDGIYLIYSN